MNGFQASVTGENANCCVQAGWRISSLLRSIYSKMCVAHGGFSLCECGVGTFILHESGHGPFVYLFPTGVASLIKNELAMEMKLEGGYTTQKYAQELHRLFEQLDPLAMKDVEGYWSHLIEDYETGL